MLQENLKTKTTARGATFAIVASNYNGEYVEPMLLTAKRELKQAGATSIEVVRVPGAFEVPVVASSLAASGKFSAIICFGVVFQGETSHAQHVGWGVTHALAQIQVQQKVPVIHGVYTFDKVEHAKVRCQGKKHNRGVECAHTAIAMAKVMKSLPV